MKTSSISFPTLLLVLGFACLGFMNAPNLVSAQLEGTCEPYAGVPECGYVLEENSLIFVPNGLNQDALSATVIPLISAVRMAPSSCRIPVLKAICGATFRNCTEFGLPMPPCQSVCQMAHESCPPEVTATLACNATDPFLAGIPGLEMLPLFPEEGWVIPIDQTTTLIIPCTNMTSMFYVDDGPMTPSFIPVETCPPDQECCIEPFAQDPDTLECDIMCPIPDFPKDQRDGVMIGFSIVGYVNTLTSIIILVCFVKDKARRNFPTLIPVVLMIASWSFTFAASWSLFAGADSSNWLCEDDVTPIDGRTPRCAAQGFFAHIGVLGTVVWICLVSVNMCLVSYEVQIPKKLLIACYVVIGVVYPLTCGIIAVSAGVYETVFYFCITPHSELNHSMGWTDGLLMVPATVFVVITFASFVLICIRLARLTGLAGFKSNWRLLALIAYLIIALFVWVTWYWINIRAPAQKIISSFEDWAFCVALGAGVPNPPDDLSEMCRDEFYHGPSFAWSVLMLTFTFCFCLFTSILIGWLDIQVIGTFCGFGPSGKSSSAGSHSSLSGASVVSTRPISTNSTASMMTSTRSETDEV